MDSSKYRSRGYSTMGSNTNKRPPPYLLLLLLALGAAALSVGILHKMRERRVFAILLQERDQQLISLQALLQKEQEISKEMRRKLDALEAKTSILSIERTELKNKLMDSETTTTYLTNTQKELEAALVEKEGHINQLKENTADSGPDQMAAIKELLQQKEAELEEIKTKLHDYKKPDTNNENTTSDTVVPEDSANPGDSIPASAAEHHSYNNSASESNQDESTGASTNNENETADNLVLDKYTNSSDSTPASTEEPHPSDSTASESNPQDGSSEEHFIKLTTNREDDGLQDKTGDENGNSDDALQGSHSEKSELPQWSSKLADNKDNSTEELDDTRQLENPQGDGSYESRGSKLLEKEVESTKEIEPMKETNPETELETSKDSLSEANQNSTQAVEPVADPAGGKPNMSIYNDETKETSKRRRRRKFRSRRKRINAAAANVDGEVTKVR
ncbi:putative leucine-rich repeat-containing protein DDB_G0290503 isoform X1 [Oryza brachyantha]|uniref:putative leucine-rich repeat-containing protein DDB_G0290503 isoform X1 n=1 Tax=Oryza brachyantha TaxID=4533 RepID=UPI001ADA74CD|nr:putative leucine-rich repeat-containing protein DDB_G0290503 isoform X1 [Oryza brachyantha]XP_040379576.1 putative leucine-rich repeat-containing protein DDB_G0290503 isoform X1 [Oryza brachyantha]